MRLDLGIDKPLSNIFCGMHCFQNITITIFTTNSKPKASQSFQNKAWNNADRLNTEANFVGHIKGRTQDEIEIIDTLGERVELDKKNS